MKDNNYELIKKRAMVEKDKQQTVLKSLPENDKENTCNVVLNEDANVKFLSTLGTIDRDCALTFLTQLVDIYPNNRKENTKDIFNKLTPMLHGIGPKDELEGMLALQMVAVHNLTMEMAKRAIESDSTEVVDSKVNRVVKLSRTFTAQIEALGKHRTKGQQKVVVEHVTVNRGGQAIVGTVEQGGSGVTE